MALIQWNDKFTIGIADVDHEHKELIDLINRLYEALQQNAEAEAIEGFLGEIYSQISAHFALEEKLMRQLKYDQYQEHKDDHERLLDEIRDIMDDYADQQSFDEQRLADRLDIWFTEHFRTKDVALHKYLQAAGITIGGGRE